MLRDLLKKNEELHNPYNVCNISVHNVCNAMDKLKSGIGWDRIHTSHIKNGGYGFHNLVLKFFDKNLSHTNYAPQSRLRGEIRQEINDNKLDREKSDNYRAIMNYSMFLKVLEYTWLLYSERYIPIDSH